MTLKTTSLKFLSENGQINGTLIGGPCRTLCVGKIFLTHHFRSMK